MSIERKYMFRLNVNLYFQIVLNVSAYVGIVHRIIKDIKLLSNEHFYFPIERALVKVEIIIKQKAKVQYLIVVDRAIKTKRSDRSDGR